MRARELLQENYNQNLESDLNDLLIGTKANGATDIGMQDLILQLQNMGYSVTSNSLMALLMHNPNVLNATPESIKLKTTDDAAALDQSAEDDAEHVTDMAVKAAKKMKD